jgi:hypothetical protein
VDRTIQTDNLKTSSRSYFLVECSFFPLLSSDRPAVVGKVELSVRDEEETQ